MGQATRMTVTPRRRSSTRTAACPTWRRLVSPSSRSSARTCTRNCTAVIDEFEERECFDVTGLMCSLAESIQYEMVDETYTVQRCTGVTDRVCATVYDLAQSTK